MFAPAAVPAVAPGDGCATGTWLSDGTPVRIRPIRRGDLELERRFVEGLSARTRYLRLLSPRRLLPGELERLTDIDPTREIALTALVSADGAQEQIGVARCVHDVANGEWECAIVVTDAWQGRGLGEALLRRLVECAEAAGIEVLSGNTLAENQRMLSLARRLGFTARRRIGDGPLVRLERRLRTAML